MIGKQISDPFNKQKENRALATEYFKKASSIWDKIFGEESIITADTLLELGIFNISLVFSTTARIKTSRKWS